MAEPLQRFEQGEQATALITATVQDDCSGYLDFELGGRPLFVPLGHPAVTAVHGDIRPTLVQALRDAIAYHDDGACGDPEHLGQVEQYERALDALQQLAAATVP